MTDLHSALANAAPDTYRSVRRRLQLECDPETSDAGRAPVWAALLAQLERTEREVRADEEQQKLDDEEECLKCGSKHFWVPTFCNFGHCAECFAPCDPEHKCKWNGTEHESFGPSEALPGNVKVGES